eukprot:scaffold1.g5407.t1
MHAVPLSFSQQYPPQPGQAPPPQFGAPFGGPPPQQFVPPGPPPPGMQGPGGEVQDPAQLQQLVQLLGAKMLPKQTAVVECPKSMVGRVIGKGGETIKALQQYTGAMIQIDQSTDPTRVTIAGSPQSLQLAVSMVNDIVRGTFKGFAMLRQIAISTSQQAALGQYGQPQPVYVQGYGFVPPSQVYNPEEANLASLLRGSPTGPLTPPMTPLRTGPGAPPGAGPGGLPPGAAGGLGPEALAALLGQNPGALAGLGGGVPPQHHHPGMGGHPAGGSHDALIAQLLGQLSVQQPGPQSMGPPGAMPPPQHGGGGEGGAGAGPLAGADQASIQALLAQAGLLGAGQPMGLPTGAAAGMSAAALPASAAQGLPPSTSLMLSATGAPAVVAASPAASASGGSPAAAPASARAPSSTGSPPPGHAAGAASPSSALATLLHSVGSGGAPAAPAPGSGGTGSAGAAPGSARGVDSAPASYLGTTSPTSSTPRTGSGRASPAIAGIAAANPALSRRSAGSDGGSPLGRYGPVGGGVSLSPAAEGALAAKMAAVTTTDAPLPAGWTKVADPEGPVYYVNQVTKESTLTLPTSPAFQAVA